MTEECPKCKAKYPDVVTMSWGGGHHIVITSHRCNKCGTRFKVTFDCRDNNKKIEVTN
jgi:transcriptional regulator NrdR family protein